MRLLSLPCLLLLVSQVACVRPSKTGASSTAESTAESSANEGGTAAIQESAEGIGGDDPLGNSLHARRNEAVEVFQRLADGEDVSLCEVSRCRGDSRVCETLRGTAANEALKTAAVTFLRDAKNARRLRDLAGGVPFEIHASVALPITATGETERVAVTALSENGPIHWSRATADPLSPIRLLAILVHELVHKMAPFPADDSPSGIGKLNQGARLDTLGACLASAVDEGGGGSKTFFEGGTFTVPLTISSLYFEAWGAGGGGAGSSTKHGSGGGGGAYCASVISVEPGAVCTVTVGSGGAGGASGANAADGFPTSLECAGSPRRPTAGGGRGGRTVAVVTAGGIALGCQFALNGGVGFLRGAGGAAARVGVGTPQGSGLTWPWGSGGGSGNLPGPGRAGSPGAAILTW